MRILLAILLVCASSLLCGQSFVVETYFDEDSTQLKEIIHLSRSDSTLNGPYQSYYQNGSLMAAGHYTDDIADSLWIYYFETGKKKAMGYFDMGNQAGTWTYYYENGSKKAEGYLDEGTRNGFWINFFENGKPKSEGSYWSGQKSGIWNYYYEDGSIKAQAYYENGTGIYKEFYPSGELKVEGRNKNEKSIGEWKYYWETGELQAKGRFDNGLKKGLWEFYHQNGQLSAIGDYDDGLRTGLWKYYHPNGNLRSEGFLIEDKKDGVWTLYYNSGEVLGEGKYDQSDGRLKEYYPSGTLKSEGRIEDGKREGSWIFYNESGVKEGEAIFDDGTGTYKGFYPDGTLKMEGQLQDNKRVGTWTLYDKDGEVVGTYKPIYEEQEPFFKLSDNAFANDKSKNSDIPEYKFKNRNSRYFDERINEFRAAIIATNPLWLLLGRIPLSLEYYMQERLGYELEYIHHRSPFFTGQNNVGINEIYVRGNEIAFKQKFYTPENRLGMFYFGHEIRFEQLDHSVNVLNGTGPFATDQITVSETSAGYGLLVGWRWLQSAGDAGFTVDLFVGANIGYRSVSENYDRDEFDSFFQNVNQSELYLPFNVGLNLGWAGPKQKNKVNE